MIKMEQSGEKLLKSDAVFGDMIFEPVLEEGVFRFDCSVTDREAAFPSLSFTSTNIRDTPIMIDKHPVYIPSFLCDNGQRTVKLEVITALLIFNRR